jgi:hypothetical protein
MHSNMKDFADEGFSTSNIWTGFFFQMMTT